MDKEGSLAPDMVQGGECCCTEVGEVDRRDRYIAEGLVEDRYFDYIDCR